MRTKEVIMTTSWRVNPGAVLPEQESETKDWPDQEWPLLRDPTSPGESDSKGNRRIDGGNRSLRHHDMPNDVEQKFERIQNDENRDGEEAIQLIVNRDNDEFVDQEVKRLLKEKAKIDREREKREAQFIAEEKKRKQKSAISKKAGKKKKEVDKGIKNDEQKYGEPLDDFRHEPNWEHKPEIVDFRVVVNIDGLNLSKASKDFYYGPSEKIPGCVIINGIFKMSDKTELSLSQVLQPYRGEKKIAWDNGNVIFKVVGEPVDMIEWISPEPVLTLKQGVELFARSQLMYVDMTNGTDTIALKTRIRSAYLTYMRDFKHLDTYIAEILATDEFQKLIYDRGIRHANSYSLRLKSKLQQYYGWTSNKDVEHEHFKDYLNDTVAGVCLGILTTAAGAFLVMCPPALAGVVVVGVATTVLVPLVQYARYYDEDSFIHWMLKKLNKIVPTKDNQFVPAFRNKHAKFAASLVPPESINYEQRRGAKIERKYTPVEMTDEPVVEYDAIGFYADAPGEIPLQVVQNIDSGLSQRFLNPPDPDPMHEAAFFVWATNQLKKYMPVFDIGPVSELKYCIEHWGTKRGTRIYNKYLSKGIPIKVVHTFFMKLEVYVGKRKGTMKTRPIFSCPEMIIAHFGAYFAKLGKLMAKHWNYHNNIFYACSVTPSQLGYAAEKIFSKYKYKFEHDFKSYDGLLTYSMLQIEQYFLKNHVKGMPADIDNLYDQWGMTTATDKTGQLKLKMMHGRRSGDLPTGQFNSLLNVLIMAYVLECELPEIGMMVLGDDNLLGTDKYVAPDVIAKRMNMLGLEGKLIERHNIEDAEFCSGIFWNIGGRYKWGSKPGRVLFKNWNLSRRPPREWLGILKCNFISALPVAMHVPILGKAYKAALKNSGEIKLIRDTRGLNPFRPRGGVCDQPTLETYTQFCRRYSMSMDEVIGIEEWFTDNIDIYSFPMKLNGNWFNKIFEVDNDCEWFPNPSIRDSQPKKIKPIKTKERVQYEYEAVNIAPIEEEIEKLKQGKFELIPTLKAAYKFGLEENLEYRCTGREYLHMLFSTVSYFNVEKGVKLHRAFNKRQIALHENSSITPMCATRKKQKKNNAAPKVMMKALQANTAVMKKTKNMIKSVEKKPSLGRRVLRGVFGAAGGVFGSVGGEIGNYIGDRAADFFGFALKDGKTASDRLPFKHREFVENVTSEVSVDGRFTTYKICPSNDELMKVASGLSDNYQRWKVRKLACVYTPITNPITSESTAGVIMFGYQPYMNAPDFNTREALEASKHVMTTRISDPLVWEINVSANQTVKNRYIEHGGDIGDFDENLTCAGKITVAVFSCPTADVTIGRFEFWVDLEMSEIIINPLPSPSAFRYSRIMFENCSSGLGTLVGIGGAMADQIVVEPGHIFFELNEPAVFYIGHSFNVCGNFDTFTIAYGGFWRQPTLSDDHSWMFDLDSTASKAAIKPTALAPSGNALQNDVVVSDIGGTCSIDYTLSGTSFDSLDIYIWQGPPMLGYDVSLPDVDAYLKLREHTKVGMKKNELIKQAILEEEEKSLAGFSTSKPLIEELLQCAVNRDKFNKVSNKTPNKKVVRPGKKDKILARYLVGHNFN